MITFDLLRTRIKSHITGKKGKSISGLGEALGMSTTAQRQAKSEKVGHTLKGITKALTRLENIATYLGVPVETLLLREEVCERLWEAGELKDGSFSDSEMQLIQNIRHLPNGDRKMLFSLVEHFVCGDGA